jgi:DNA-binding MarR family transcriptional regulator
MGIEQEIGQAKFRNDYQKAVINLIYTFNWMNGKIKNMLDEYDITSQQFNILRILRGAGTPISTLQIRQRMLDKMSDTSRIVDRLIKKSMVQKVICAGDRRLVDVSITAEGTALLQRIDVLQDEMDSVFKNLSPEEAITLNELLDKIRNAE